MGFIEGFMGINDFINGIVWGPPVLILVVGTGMILTFGSKVFQLAKIKVWWKATFGALTHKDARDGDASNISPFQAVTTAMAATIGTGNVVGVATAIYLGGPGAVFWMWFSAFFGMMTKYSEIVLAVKFREVDAVGTHHGGPMYYIEKGLNMKWLALIFAFFGAFAAFGIGNLTQSNAIASAINRSFGIPNFATGIVLAILVGAVIIGGIKRIGAVTERLIPFMAIFYFIGGIIIVIMNGAQLPSAFGAIFAGAFSFESAGGGLMGYAIMRAMRFGIARGVFSNEAGLGSAPIAHAASKEKDPVKQGLWGVFEVFLDTMVVCTITALVILTSGLYGGTISGVTLVMASFEQTFGFIGGAFVAATILLFAGSTILGWSYYGQQCLRYLVGDIKAVDLGYRALFCILAIVGSVGGLAMVWDIADTLNGLMMIPNLLALLLLSKLVFQLTKEYLAAHK